MAMDKERLIGWLHLLLPVAQISTTYLRHVLHYRRLQYRRCVDGSLRAYGSKLPRNHIGAYSITFDADMV